MTFKKKEDFILSAGLRGIWRDYAGLRGIWRDYAELRGIWRDYAGFGGIWRDYAGFGGITRDLAGLRGIWRDLAGLAGLAGLGVAPRLFKCRAQLNVVYCHNIVTVIPIVNYTSIYLNFNQT